MRIRFVAALAAVALTVSAAPAADARAAQNPRLQGTWILDRAASDDIEKAIAPGMASNDQCQSPTRGRVLMLELLKSMNRLSPQYVISFDAQNVHIEEGGRPAATVPLNGSQVFWMPETAARTCTGIDTACVGLSAKVGSDALDLTLVTDDFRQIRRFAADADRLTVTVTVNMTCALPMRYRLMFTRGAGL